MRVPPSLRHADEKAFIAHTRHEPSCPSRRCSWALGAVRQCDRSSSASSACAAAARPKDRDVAIAINIALTFHLLNVRDLETIEEHREPVLEGAAQARVVDEGE